MRISFDISEDKELREAVKELIREQVVSVIREVIGEQLDAIVEQKKRSFEKLADGKANRIVDYLQSRMDATIRETMNPGGKSLAVTMIDRAVKEAMTASVLKKIESL